MPVYYFLVARIYQYHTKSDDIDDSTECELNQVFGIELGIVLSGGIHDYHHGAVGNTRNDGRDTDLKPDLPPSVDNKIKDSEIHFTAFDPEVVYVEALLKVGKKAIHINREV